MNIKFTSTDHFSLLRNVFFVLFAWLLFNSADAQDNNVQVSGIVKGENGEPLVGVTVLADNESTEYTNGVATNVDGMFTFSDLPTDGQYSFTFSYIGYKPKTIKGQKIGNGDKLSLIIDLEVDSKQLNEVVVIGYGTQKKANLTGSVAQIEAEAIESRPVTNISSALQGLLPGVTVTNGFGVPGNHNATIRIRGVGTWGNATPLIVIDGIPGGDPNILNTNDIASVTVLKDAASSAIYGVRGANGVIVITTKKGSGEPTIAYEGYFGLQTPTELPEFLGSPKYMELLNEAEINAGRNPTYTPEEIEIARNGSDPNYYANTNWVDEIFKDYTTQQSHNLSIKGGSENLNYYLSYGYLKEGGLVTGDNFKAKRHNIRAKFNTTLMDRLDLDANLGYLERDFTGSSAGTGVLYSAIGILPLVPLRFTTGGWGYLGGQRNPVAIATDGGTNEFASQEITVNLSATLNLFEGFKLKGQYGIVRSNSKRNTFDKTVNYFSPDDGSLIYRNNFPNKIDTRDYTSVYQTFIATAEYEKQFNTSHDVKILLGASQEETIGEIFAASRTNLPTQVVGHINLGTEDQLNGGTSNQNALRSVFGRVNYGFRDKYLVEGNFRYDGSTRFAKGVRWNLFSSGSIGWVFTEEDFFSGLRHIVEFGKIRVSYGSLGNDRIADWAYLDVLGPVGTEPLGYQNTIGYQQTVVANKILTWESAIKKNVGLDLALLDNRLQVTGDYFINETNDILLRVPLPDVFGATEPYQNAGKVENKGWELQLGWNDQKGDFRYDVDFNISDVKNKVVSLGGTEPTVGDQVRLIGEPLDAFYGLVADRIAQENDFSYNPEKDDFIPDFPYIETEKPVEPGDLIFKDLNGDGKITLEDDRKVIGSPIPRYTYGIRVNAGWRAFDFSLFLQGVGQVDGYLYGSARHAFTSEATFPQKIHLDRWTPENTDASYPRLVYQQDYNQRLSTYWLEDASYIRLKNIQLGYTLPKHITEQLRISKLRVYVSADNLLTKTDYFYGYDPESPVSSGNFYPQVKTFVFGLNVNFK